VEVKFHLHPVGVFLPCFHCFSSTHTTIGFPLCRFMKATTTTIPTTTNITEWYCWIKKSWAIPHNVVDTQFLQPLLVSIFFQSGDQSWHHWDHF
jgi:hypothetical protein